MKPPVIKVMIVDDHPMYREGLRATLEAEENMVVVGEAEDGSQAMTSIQTLQPDVILMDLSMAEMDGIEATRRMRELHPEIRVLVLTMREDNASLDAALKAGAAGYLLKGARRAEITRAILAVAEGGAIFSAAVADRVTSGISRSAEGGRSSFPELTDREIEVLDLVARGLGNIPIAKRLFISEKTVKNHLNNIFSKLGAPDRPTLIIRARDVGLGISD